MNYHKIAFTDQVKLQQKLNGSRANYQRVEDRMEQIELSPMVIKMIEDRDSFYLATMGENGFPYIQHRGGPKGFLKVLDERTLGFLDFSGNKQYITLGNLKTNNKVSLILMDYIHRTRLKIYAEAEIKDITEQNLKSQLDLHYYPNKSERIILFHVKAFDWNCPQHITPRYSEEDVADYVKDKDLRINVLERENANLRAKLKSFQEN